MKKRRKKTLAMLLIAFIMVSAVGCGEKEKQPNSTEKGTGEGTSEGMTEDALEHLELSIGYWDGSNQFDQGDPILDMIEEKFNVTLTSKGVSWSDYKEKYKLWAAAGELPDIFALDEFNTDTYTAWIDQGVIRPLPSDLSAYPNIERVMNQPDVNPLQVDGEFYMIPRLSYQSTETWKYDRALLIRKDWLENLGLDIPVTYDQYKNVLRAFVEEDPDGNGVKDTIGLTHKQLAMLNVFYLGTTPQLVNGAWLYEDGQWIPPFVASTVPKGIEQLRELYQEGLLDQDFGIMNTGDGQEKFAQGKTGILAQQASPYLIREVKDLWMKYDHDTEFKDAVAIISPWANEDGEQLSFVQTTFWSETYFNGDMSDVKMERTMMLFDYLLSEEWREIKGYGIEGVDYEKEGDTYKVLLDTTEDGTYVPLASKYPSLKILSQLGAWDNDEGLLDTEKNRATFGDDIMDMVKEYGEYTEAHVKPMPTNFDVKLLLHPSKSKIDGIPYRDDLVRLIMTDGDIEVQWQEVLDKYEQYNLSQEIEEVNKKINELGIE